MKIALLQMTSGIDPAANAETLVAAIEAAAKAGAAMLFTPEMSGLVDSDAKRAAVHVVGEDRDPVLQAIRAAAQRTGITIHIGSLALLGDGKDGRWANRGLVIDASGAIVARYDKMHLFDVDLPTGESWRESARYVPGAGPAIAETPVGTLGLSVCYDLRFPALYQALSAAGATVLAVPAAFTVPTGEAHWRLLLSARAIENAAFVVAAAQVGQHADGRTTYGHSLVVDPWGRVLLDMEKSTGLGFCDLDLSIVAEVRLRIPVIAHRRAITVIGEAVATA